MSCYVSLDWSGSAFFPTKKSYSIPCWDELKGPDGVFWVSTCPLINTVVASAVSDGGVLVSAWQGMLELEGELTPILVSPVD
jgi:hypothetical protein